MIIAHLNPVDLLVKELAVVTIEAENVISNVKFIQMLNSFSFVFTFALLKKHVICG